MPELPNIDNIVLLGYFSLLISFIVVLWTVNKVILMAKRS